MRKTQPEKKTSMSMKIVLDEDKIRREGKYDADKMYERIDKAFARLDIPKVRKGVYRGTGKSKDHAHFMSLCMGLTDADWFMENAAKWLWKKEDGGVEDVIYETNKFYRKYGYESKIIQKNYRL